MEEPPPALARSPPPLPQPPPSLPQPPPPLHQPPPLQMVLADVSDCPAAAPSTPSAEPSPAIPLLLATLPPLSATAGPLTRPSSESSTASALTASPSKHVAQKRRIGNSGEVNKVDAAPLLEISRPMDDDMDEDSTSLSAICARMIQSCSYTVEVQVCGTGGNSTFYWEIVEGTSTNMKDLMSCIVGTFSFPFCSEDKILLEYFNCITGEFISVSSDEECMKMYQIFHQNRSGQLIIKHCDSNDIVDVPCAPSNQTPSIALPSKPSNENGEDSVSLTDAYLANPHEEYEHVGVDEEDQYSIGSAGLDSDDEIGEKDIPNNEYVEDSSDDEEWVAEDARPDVVLEIAYDKDNPPMHIGAKYPNIQEFRLAIATYAIKKEFEFKVEKSEPSRFRAYCRRGKTCTWRIHVGRLDDQETMEIKVHVKEHTCSSTKKKKKQRSASKAWVCDKVMDWVKEDPSVRPMELRRRLLDKYKIKIHYTKVFRGKGLAMAKLFGDWDDSFDKLYAWKAEVEKRSPGSIVAIDHMEYDQKKYFIRMFVGLKPLCDGFLAGCRPFLAIDSTHLTGKYRGQLATACAIDGHNWLYPVVYGVIDSETTESWVWFMEKLREAIGCPPGLAICSDAGKGIDTAIEQVFGYAEHRECMRHLVVNFKKKFHGKVFDDHLWPAAYSWTPRAFDYHMATIEDFVDDYYSVAKFTATYAHVLPGLTDMSQWPSVKKDFILNPPILRRAPGRPKVQRHKSGAENSKSKGNKGQHQCPICKAYGHRWQSCKDAAPEALDAYAEVAKQKRDKRKKKSINTTAGTPLPLLQGPSDAIEDKVAKSTPSNKSTRSKVISAAHDSPAMSTRSKKRIAPNNQATAPPTKKKLKL